MDPWVSHTLTAVFGAALGRLPDFWLKSRQQVSDEWRTMVTQLRDRVETLELRIESIHKEHAECLEVQAELRAEIAALKAQRGEQK